MNHNFQHGHLSGYSFRGQDLAKADFSYADLRGVDFSNAILTDANFHQARLGIQTSWAGGITTIVLIAVVVAELLISAIAGCSVGPILSGGTFSILFAGLTCLVIVGLFSFASIKYSPERAIAIMGLSTVTILASIFMIALAGGALGFVPLTGRLSVSRGLTGGIAGLFMGDAITAGIMILCVAIAIAGNASAWGAWMVVLAGSGMLAVGSGLAILMSLALSLKGSKAVTNPLMNDSFINNQERLLQSSPTETWSQIITLGGNQSLLIATLGAIMITMPIVLLGAYLGRKILAGEQKYIRIRRFAVAIAAARGSRFQGAVLERADFTQATLKNADFTKAKITQTVWYQAKLLHRSRIEGTCLANPQIRKLAVTRDGRGDNFDGQDLQGLNLKDSELMKASFIDTNFYQADLQGANLSGAILVRTQLDQADLRQACLTDACIKNWGITKRTQLAKVICDSVYLDYDRDRQNRFPEARNFKRGEFLAFLRPYLHSVDVQHDRDIDPKVAAIALNHLAKQYGESIEIVGIEKQQAGVSLKIKLLDTTPSDQFQRDYQSYYREVLQMSWMMPQEVEAIATRLNELIQEITYPRASYVEQLTLNNTILVLGRTEIMDTYQQKFLLSSLLLQLKTVLQGLSAEDREDALEQWEILSDVETGSALSTPKSAKKAFRVLRGMTSNSSMDAQKIHEISILLHEIEREINKINSNRTQINSNLQTMMGNITNNGGYVGTFNDGVFNIDQREYHNNQHSISNFPNASKVQIFEKVNAYHEHNYPKVTQDIQDLLNQLALDPANYRDLMLATKQVQTAIAQNPSLKAHLASVLKSGGVEALKASFNHPVVTISVETIKRYLEAE